MASEYTNVASDVTVEEDHWRVADVYSEHTAPEKYELRVIVADIR